MAEGHDSYDASSCGSGSQDDVASWVAFDFRQLRGRSRAAASAAHGGVGETAHNGFDTITIDSDFYGYAPSNAGSAADPASWSLHPDRDSWRERDHSGSRHSASPGRHFLHEQVTSLFSLSQCPRENSSQFCDTVKSPGYAREDSGRRERHTFKKEALS